MADRYTDQIGQKGGGGYMQNTGGGAAFGVNVGQAIGRLATPIRNLGLQLQVNQDKQDQIDAAAAINDYNLRMNKYLNDPDAGVLNTDKLSLAKGITDRTNLYADDQAEDIRSRLSPGALNRFNLSEPQLRNPYVNKASAFEVTERDADAKATRDAGFNGWIETMTANPESQEMLENAREWGFIAVEESMPGASNEAKLWANQQWDSKLAQAQLTNLMRTDPVMAARVIEGNERLTPTDKETLLKSLQSELTMIDTQNMSQQLWSQFGTDDRAARDYIRKHYEGSQEQRYLSGYNGFLSEEITRQNRAEAEIKKAQDEYFRTEVLPRINSGQATYGELELAYMNGQLNTVGFNTALDKMDVDATRAQATKQGINLYGADAWNALSQNDRDEIVSLNMGVTQADRDEAIARAQAGLLDHSYTAERINEDVAAGLLTEREGSVLKTQIAQQTAESNQATDIEAAAFERDVIDLFTDETFYGQTTDATRLARKNYQMEISKLSPGDKDYPQKLRDARINSLARTIDEMGASLLTNRGKLTKQGDAFKIITDRASQTPVIDTFTGYSFDDYINLAEPQLPQTARVKAILGMNAQNQTRDGGARFQGPRLETFEGEEVIFNPTTQVRIPASDSRMVMVQQNYGPMIQRYAEEYGVPLNLVYAVIKQESGGNPNAESPDNPGLGTAKGFMQLLDSTAEGLGVDNKNPEQNLKGGIKYLGQLLKTFDGNELYATYAYHQGPGKVREVIRGKGKIGDVGKKYGKAVMALASRFGSVVSAPANPRVLMMSNVYDGAESLDDMTIEEGIAADTDGRYEDSLRKARQR